MPLLVRSNLRFFLSILGLCILAAFLTISCGGGSGGGGSTSTPTTQPGKLSAISLSPTTIAVPNSATGTISLTAAAGTGGLVVNLTSNQPFLTVPASVTVPAGKSSATFLASTKSTGASGAATVSATDANGNTATASVTVTVATVIRLQSISISPTTLTVPSSGTGTINLSGAAGVGGLTINLSSNQAYLKVPATVTVPAGTSTASFSVSAVATGSVGPATITGTDPNGNSATAAVTVTQPSVRLQTISVSPTSITGGSGGTGTVTLSGSAGNGGVVIDLTSNQSFLHVPASVSVPAGKTSATFNVSTSTVNTASNVTVTGTDPNGFTATTSVTVTLPLVRLQSLAFSPSSVTGPGTVTGTVVLTAIAPSSGFTVNLASNEAFLNFAQSVTVPAGSISTTFTVNTLAVPTNTTATVSASDVNGFTANGSFQVTPPIGTVVEMNDAEAYSPVTLKVSAGTKITWLNVSSMAHTVTGDVPSQGIASEGIVPYGTFTWQVPSTATSGTAFYYHCEYHGSAGNGTSLGSGMAAVVIVK